MLRVSWADVTTLWPQPHSLAQSMDGQQSLPSQGCPSDWSRVEALSTSPAEGVLGGQGGRVGCAHLTGEMGTGSSQPQGCQGAHLWVQYISEILSKAGHPGTAGGCAANQELNCTSHPPRQGCSLLRLLTLHLRNTGVLTDLPGCENS